MPAPPELGARGRAVRVVEVGGKAVAEEPGRPERQARVTGEVEIDLAVEGDRGSEKRVGIIPGEIREYRVSDLRQRVGDHRLVDEPAQHQARPDRLLRGREPAR